MTTQIQFTPEILKTLSYERYHHPVPLVQRRMEALWLKSHQLPHHLIATLVGVTENTIRDYFELFSEGGIEKLKEVDFYRPESALVEHTTSLEAYAPSVMATRPPARDDQRSAERNRNADRHPPQ